MKQVRLAIAVGMGMLALTMSSAAWAQAGQANPPAAVKAVTAEDLTKKLPALRWQQVPLKEAAAELTRTTGITVAVDAGLSLKPVTLVTGGGTLAEAIAALAKQLPQGAAARFVAVPAGEPMPTGDLISAYLLSQDGLRRKATPTLWDPATNEIEVLGRSLSGAKAAPLMTELELKPVYVLSSGRGDALVARAGLLQAEGLQLWQEMSAEQRQQFMDNQLSGLLNMDPATRSAMFGQMMQSGQAMMQKINALPPDQRAQFFKDITGGRFDGTTPPRPNGPGGPNGNGGSR
jgi:hypothetical protein